MKPLLAALVVIGFAGCGQAISPVLDEPTLPVVVQTTARHRLQQPGVMELRIHPVNSGGQLISRQVLAQVSSTVPVKLVDGWLGAYAVADPLGPGLVVTGFAASLGDVKFQLPPFGVTLTQVHFEMVQPVRMPVRWFGDGNLGWAEGTLAVDLHTSLRLSTGQDSPLAVARLSLPVELTVTQTATGLVGVWLQLAPEGPLWRWAGLFELSDLSMTLEAFEVSDQLPPNTEFM